MVWDISDVWKRRMGVKNIASNIFYVFPIYQGAKHRSINGCKLFCREEKPTRRIGALDFLIR